MGQSVENDGFWNLGEAICSAEAGPGVHASSVTGRAINDGFSSFAESVTIIETPLVGPNEIEFEKCATETLVSIVKKAGEALLADKLCIIHQVALNRFQASREDTAKELLQLLAQTMASRIRS
jgi:hypothetical protein